MTSENRHDRFFRHHLGNVELARSFLRAYLPEDLAAILDLSTLAPAEARFPGIGEIPREGDLAFALRLRGEERDAVVLLEHKSRRTPEVGLQILRYVFGIWDLAERTGEERSGKQRRRRPLPLVVPVVVYHGRNRWRGTRLAALTGLPAPAARHVPRVECVLVDLGALPDARIMGPATLRAVLLALRYARDERLAIALPKIFRALGRAPLGEGKKKVLVGILRYLEGNRRIGKAEILAAVRSVFPDEEEEIMGSFSLELVEKGRRQGREEGEIRRARRDVVGALRARFKRVPRAVSSRVGGIADLEVLDRLHDAAVTSPSMGEFREEMDRLDA